MTGAALPGAYDLLMKCVAVAFLMFLFVANMHADTCVTTSDPWSAHSANGEWRLDVTAITERGRERRRGTLSRRRANGTWRRHARWTFANPWGPGGARVANDGTVITLNDICSAGTGKHVVVIYRPDGSLVRSMELADLLIADDIAVLTRTVSSIKWLRDLRIEEEARRLVLEIDDPLKKQSVALPVSLETGELLAEKRRRLVGPPILDPVVSYRAATEAEGACKGDGAISSRELLDLATAPVIAPYTDVAKKARISGDVVLEIVVNETGAVDSVVVVKPLPFGLDQSAVAAAHQWRFQPGRRRCGRFAMSFGIVR